MVSDFRDIFLLFFSLGRRRRRELGLDVTVPNQWYGKVHLPPRACCCCYSLPTFRPLHIKCRMICERVQACGVIFIVIMWELMDESTTISGLVTKGPNPVPSTIE